MAIINLTKKNFTNLISKSIDDAEDSFLISLMLAGGKDKMKEVIADVPDEQLIWVNTDHISAASAPTKVHETGEIVFRIYFKYTDSKDNAIWIKGEDYKRFIMAWSGEANWLSEGEYNVQEGHYVTISDDSKKVIVKNENCAL
jgi:hypothetical protein